MTQKQNLWNKHVVAKEDGQKMGQGGESQAEVITLWAHVNHALG